MDYNTPNTRKSITEIFPKLEKDSHFFVCSPFTYEYNCIAFAMGLDDRWVDSSDIPWHWWPSGVVKAPTPQALKDAFAALGFEECKDDSVEADYDKVALYCKDGMWTHAAKIVETPLGAYHSKFGALYDGLHSGGNVLEDVYGNIYCFMKRLKTLYSITTAIKQTKPNVSHVFLNGIWYAFFNESFYTESGKEVLVRRVCSSGEIIITNKTATMENGVQI